MQRILELLVPGTFKYHKSKIRYPQVKGTLGRASYKTTPLQVLGRCGYVRNDHFRGVVYKSIVGTSLTFLWTWGVPNPFNNQPLFEVEEFCGIVIGAKANVRKNSFATMCYET